MKILSLNLWNGGKFLSEIIKFLGKEQPDICLLQEVYDGHLDEILAHRRARGLDDSVEDRFRTVEILSQEFPQYNFAFDQVYLDTRPEEGDINEGSLLMSNLPILEHQSCFFDEPYGPRDHDHNYDYENYPSALQKVVVKTPAGNLTLLNVHGPWNLNGGIDNLRRLNMQRVILENLGNKTIIAGDFNVRPDTETIRGIEQKLKNVFTEEIASGDIRCTFNLQYKDLVKNPGFASAVVDFVFVSPEIGVLSKRVPDDNVSDHLPLVVEVDL